MIDELVCPRCMSSFEVEEDSMSLSFLGSGKLILEIESDCTYCEFEREFQTSLEA